MKKNLNFTVTAPTELLPFLVESFKGKSRNYVKGLLKRGQILVNGNVNKDYAKKLFTGQQITVLINAPLDREKMRIPVIYEDSEIIVIDKPAGMLSISTDKGTEKTAHQILNNASNSHGRIFIVHRLDRDTSGVMLFAKNETLKTLFQDNWEKCAIQRGYICLVEGAPTEPDGKIVSKLSQTKNFKVYSDKPESNGKLAITNYRTIKKSEQYSLLEINLETGRKNQIRVHMKDLGCPVVGDKKYGATLNPIKRLGLHANLLIIKHPITGKEMKFVSKTPPIYKKAVTIQS